ncbi:MAG: hypothetical protein ACSHX6_09045 [Akkermansiaceae bacterium]
MNKIILILLFFFQVPSMAQEKKSSNDIQLRFTSFGVKDIGGKYILAAKEKRTQLFAIPNNGFSTPITAPAKGREIALGSLDAETFKNLATIKLPEVGKRFLVLVLPAKEGALKAVVVRADDPTFRPSQIMIMNLANETFAAQLGEKKLSFLPGSRTIFRPQRKGELANYQVRFFKLKDGKPKLFAASLWPYFENKRAFVFLYKNPATGSPTYRSIDEFTGWLKE